MGLFSLIGGIIGGGSSKKAARRAAQLQYDAAMEGIEETRRQFDLTRQDFASEQQLGEDSIAAYRRLTGLDGADAQSAEIEALRESPLYQSLYNNGLEANLAAASATGGLRGGNFKETLARFGGDTLSQVIRTQLGDYASGIGIGMGSDSAIGNFGANAVAQQNAQRNFGAGAQAQAQLIRGGINAQNWQNFGGVLDGALGSLLGGFKF